MPTITLYGSTTNKGCHVCGVSTMRTMWTNHQANTKNIIKQIKGSSLVTGNKIEMADLMAVRNTLVCVTVSLSDDAQLLYGAKPNRREHITVVLTVTHTYVHMYIVLHIHVCMRARTQTHTLAHTKSQT